MIETTDKFFTLPQDLSISISRSLAWKAKYV